MRGLTACRNSGGLAHDVTSKACSERWRCLRGLLDYGVHCVRAALPIAEASASRRGVCSSYTHIRTIYQYVTYIPYIYVCVYIYTVSVCVNQEPTLHDSSPASASASKQGVRSVRCSSEGAARPMKEVAMRLRTKPCERGVTRIEVCAV